MGSIVVLLLSGCKNHSIDVETYLPEPEWMDSIDAPTVDTVSEVQTLWLSEKRCCENKRKLERNSRRLYKACYVAIANHSSDQLLVAKCLQLMDNGMEADVRYKVNRHFIENYFDFKSPVDRCANCLPADPIANTSRDLAWQENRRGNPEAAIKIAQRVLDERLDEIMPYVQMNLYAVIAYSYASTVHSDEQLQALRDARERLRSFSEKGGAYSSNFKTFEKYLGSLLEI